MNIIMMNKPSTYYKLVLAIELIFCNNTNASGKILLSFYRGKQGDANFGFANKNTLSLQHYIFFNSHFCLWTNSSSIILFSTSQDAQTNQEYLF